jgi:hypothetical protein
MTIHIGPKLGDGAERADVVVGEHGDLTFAASMDSCQFQGMSPLFQDQWASSSRARCLVSRPDHRRAVELHALRRRPAHRSRRAAAVRSGSRPIVIGATTDARLRMVLTTIVAHARIRVGYSSVA